MYDKLVNVGIDRKREIEEEYGGFNDVPPNTHEITPEEFAKSKFFTYPADIVGYRQFMHDGVWQSVFLYFYFDGTGIGIFSSDGKPRYIRFAKCEHKYLELSQAECRKNEIFHGGRCYHVYRCEKCGFIHSEDSSG